MHNINIYIYRNDKIAGLFYDDGRLARRILDKLNAYYIKNEKYKKRTKIEMLLQK